MILLGRESSLGIGVELHRVYLTIEREIHLFTYRKEDVLAVSGPLRSGRAAFVVGHFPDLTAIRIHGVDFVTASSVRGERDLGAVRRPGRPSVEGRVVGQIARLAAIAVRKKNFGIILAHHSAEGDL